MLAVFESVEFRTRQDGSVFLGIGEIDHRVVFGVPKVDVGRVFRQLRQVFGKFEIPAAFERGGDKVEVFYVEIVFRKVFGKKDSAQGMSDVGGGFGVKIRREFLKKHLPFRIPGVAGSRKIGDEHPEPVGEFTVEGGFPSGAVFEKPHFPSGNRFEIVVVRIESLAAFEDDEGREGFHNYLALGFVVMIFSSK